MSGRLSVVEDVREEYGPFVSDESLSLEGDTTRNKPIKILQDTGITQSLMLKRDPFGSNSDKFLIIQDVSIVIVSVPLH